MKIFTILTGILFSLRPKQWSKNLFVFAALLFSRNIQEPYLFLLTLVGFIVFCCISGAGYLLNDLIDAEKDKHHPEKSKRPIASGKLPVPIAIYALIIILIFSLAISYAVNLYLFFFILGYFLLQTAYSFALKNIVILDVLSITAGFVIRVFSGAIIINVEISSWLIICTFLLALFLALSKRRHEIVLLDTKAGKHRRVLNQYSTYFLDQMISVVTASTVIAYALYTLSEQTINKFNTSSLVFTVPFVIYGIFRYLYLIHIEKRGGSPEMMFLTDLPLLADILLWALTSGLIIYL